MRANVVYPVLWIIWIAMFLAVEFTALGTGNDRFTLSDYVWKLEQINQAWTCLRWFVAAFCIWLFFHLAFGIFRLCTALPVKC